MYWTQKCKHSYAYIILITVFAFAGLQTGCAVVSVKESKSATVEKLKENKSSILTSDKLSMTTLNVLELLELTQNQCLDNVDACLAKVERVSPKTSELYLSIASELYLTLSTRVASSSVCRNVLPKDALVGISSSLFGKSLINNKDDCLPQFQDYLLNSIRHSYAYLLFGRNPWQMRSFEDRHTQVRDFYNTAVSRFVQTGFDLFKPGQNKTNTNYEILNNQIYIDDKTQVLKVYGEPEQLIPSMSLNIEGLRVIHKRDGFGVSFVAVLPQKNTTKNIADSDHQFQGQVIQSQYLPLTIAMRVNGSSILQIIGAKNFNVEIYNPLEQDTYRVRPLLSIPLTADYTAPYGLWLAQTPLAKQAFASLLNSNSTFKPTLYMIAPYDPNKRVIILLHGIASSPEAWISLTNDILGDPLLRDHYQVWQIFYPTKLPLLENRYQIYNLINQAYKTVDPNGQQYASQQSVLIGHSMGGLLSKFLLSKADLTLSAQTEMDSFQKYQLSHIDAVKVRYQFEPLKNVTRAVLIASPLKGTDYVNRWYTTLVRKVIGTPKAALKATHAKIKAVLSPEDALRIDESKIFDVQNSATELGKDSQLMQITKNVSIEPQIKVHTIIGNVDNRSDLSLSSDGIVPYNSSHLDGVVSEKVIVAGHSVQETPEAILELRRILRQHLKDTGSYVTPDNPEDDPVLKQARGESTK